MLQTKTKEILYKEKETYVTKQKIKARKTIMFNVYIYVREDI